MSEAVWIVHYRKGSAPLSKKTTSRQSALELACIQMLGGLMCILSKDRTAR